MEHCGFIVVVRELKPHPNADKLKIANFYGNETCVSIDTYVGDIGIYFPSDLQLSEEFCEINHLCRKKKDGTPDTGYLDPDKRNIKAIKLRGEKSDGIFMPLSSITYTGVNLDDLSIGSTVTILNGHEICKKYIPKHSHREGNYSSGNKTRKHHAPISPLFAEHADTEQLAYNLGAFKPGDEIEITLKMHGTSQRTGYLPVLKGYDDSWPCQVRNWLWFWFNRITKKNDLYTTFDKMKHDGKPYYKYDYISGTRRVVLEDYAGGFYGSNEFREQHSKMFDGKLMKGETVYYEVVGFTTTGQPIMNYASNKKLNDKEFIKQYGEKTVFSYGCSPYSTEQQMVTLKQAYGTAEEACNHADLLKPQSDIYVYRMTMTNEDGFVVEYSPDFMRYRCDQMGVKTVPILWKGTIPEHPGSAEDPTVTAGEWIKNVAERFYDGPDPVGKTHVREGVVVRIINRPKFAAYKHKNFAFKMLEGLIKESAEAPDMEEAQETNEDVE